MKKTLLAILMISLGGSIFSGCGGSTKTTATSKTDSSKTTAVVYTCPMHPEVTSDKPGKCPKCGMDLVIKK